jgi:hypothetical protein
VAYSLELASLPGMDSTQRTAIGSAAVATLSAPLPAADGRDATPDAPVSASMAARLRGPNGMDLFLFGSQKSTFGPYLAAMHRILIPVMSTHRYVFAACACLACAVLLCLRPAAG